jgi:hypothetical protein
MRTTSFNPFKPFDEMMKNHFNSDTGFRHREDRDERGDNPLPDLEAEVLDDPTISLKVTGSVLVDKVIETGEFEYTAEPYGVLLTVNKIPVELSEVQQRIIIVALGEIADDALINEIKAKDE